MSRFQIFTADEIQLLRKGGKILRDCLTETAKRVASGMTTKDLDTFAEDFIRSHDGATPAFKGYKGYPGTLCTSVNDECVHGIPGARVLNDGDIISLDGGVIFGGFYTDACITVPVGSIGDDVMRFLNVSESALNNAIAIVRPGAKIGDLSAEIQKTVEEAGYSCVNSLTGHGLGTTLHQFPDIPNTGKRGTGPVLPVGTLIAIEPITAMGRPNITEDDDGWTIRTADGSLAAHFEHSVLTTQNGCEIIA